MPATSPLSLFPKSLALRLWKALPSPTSPFGFSLAIVGSVFLAASAVSALLGFILYQWYDLYEYVGILMLGVMISFVAYGLYVITYVTIRRKWDEAIGWWLDFGARRVDRFLSFSSNFRVIRDRFGVDHIDHDDGAGLFLTMAPKQRFPKRETSKLCYHDDRMVTVLAASRAGKGRSVIIPSLANHEGSVMVYDPAGELWKETAEYRRKVLGQRTILLDPFNVTGEETDTWNPLSEIDFETDPFAVDKVGMIAESLHDATGGDTYWTSATRRMLSMMMLYIGSNSIDEHKNLGRVRDLLMTGDLQAVWTAMQRAEGYEGLISRFADSNLDRGKDELASVMEISRTAMKFLDSRPMTDFVRKSTFKMSELKNGKTSIYIVLPAGMGAAYKAWLRLLFNAAFDAMQDQSTPKPEIPTLLIFDEMALMGRMERIQRAAGESAKFGIKMMFCFQDLGQMKDIYGHYGYETFIANSGCLIMFANNDLETLNYLSARLGKEYYKAQSFSRGPGGASSSYSIQLREVGRPDQVEKWVSRQSGHAFVFIQGSKPMRLPRANYDQWDMLNIEKALAEKQKRLNPSKKSKRSKRAKAKAKPVVALAAE